ncbi:uncharacterized protein LOC143457235 isoform X2 [Clavelina lepadiformis]|uniref:uncharacterized protein LOC143457235 isoform X2 n=1 Tax=Clavelina lepadiformis TaxID=159417 RepID=UPI004042851B
MTELDLSFLTLQEIQIIQEVLKRSKLQDEQVERGKLKHDEVRHVSSEDFIRSKWSVYRSCDSPVYVPARDIVSAALEKPESEEIYRKESNGKDVVIGHSLNKNNENKLTPSIEDKPVEISWLQKLMGEGKEDILEQDIPNDVPPTLVQWTEDIKPPTLLELASTLAPCSEDPDDDKWKLTTVEVDAPFSDGEPKVLGESREACYGLRKQSNNEISKSAKSSQEDTAEGDRSRLTPLNSEKQFGTKGVDFRKLSMESRTSVPEHGFLGTVDISVTFYPPETAKNTKFPVKGTRFPGNNKFDILSRREYVIMTGAKLGLFKDTGSGATRNQDGELHLVVKGAQNLHLPTSIVRNKVKTYVKCYLLPDRYHGSKMRSEIIKETINPNYNHKFVFRGFTQKEFTERSIELTIGGISSSRMATTMVVGFVRLCDGNNKDAINKKISWKICTAEEADLWNKAFAEPSKEINAVLPIRHKTRHKR